MNEIMGLGVALTISVIVIALMNRVAPAIGMVDRPSARKVHDVPMARVGGWGIVIGALVPTSYLLPFAPLVQAYVAGALVLLACGSVDDCREVGHYTKFVGQLVAVIPVVTYGGLVIERVPFLEAPLPSGIGIAFTTFAMVGTINAINHSDGLDGLAGGETLLSLLAIAAVGFVAESTEVTILSLCAIGSVLGFLRYNTHPARVFMGDSGSQFLGFTLGFLAVFLTQRANPALSPAVPALLLGLPIIDILAVLYQRVYHGMNWFRATRNHIHHRLLDLGFTHHETVIIIYGVHALLVIGGGSLCYESDGLIIALYLGVCTLVFAALMICERRGWRAGRHRQTVGALRLLSLLERPSVRLAPLVVVGATVPLLLVADSVLASTVPRDFGVASAALMIAVLAASILAERARLVVVRIGCYASATFAVYLAFRYPSSTSVAISGYAVVACGILAAAILCAIRFSLTEGFHITPMDYLILFILLLVGLFAEGHLRGGGSDLGMAIVKVIVLLYGLELLMTRIAGRWNGLALASLATLGILSVRGLFAPMAGG